MKAGKNQQLVERYIDVVNDNNRDRIVSFFAENSVFENMPERARIGQQAIWDAMERYHGRAQQIDWRVECLEEREPGSVFTQGSVSYLLDGEWLRFEVNGMFEIKGSKIVRWH